MSIRNIDSELAASNLNDLFHLHRYDDCVLYINRLNHLTLKKVLLQLPIKLYLSRLPYTIEIFEALYAKIFIHEPDSFPTRLLQPERFIDKMVAYFSLLNDRQLQNEPINGDKMLDSFENVIRIISYVQPNLYSRLLFFKYACDRACLKFEKDVVTYKNFNLPFGKLKNSRTTSSFSINNFDYSNALLISKASNMNTCDKVRFEIVQTINNCHKALLKLNEYIADLKNDKNFKCYKTRKSTSTERNSRDKSTNSTIKTRSESVFSFKTSSQKDIDNFSVFTKSTICQDFIQNRLFLYKSMMNTIEPFLKTIKIEKMMENLIEKINLDKEILLVFSHLKREDTYLNSMEPLEPLFKRYSLGFERCIQIWRKKCSADQLLLYNNPCNYEIIKQQLENSLMGSNEIERNSSSKLTSSFKRKNFMLKQNYLNTLSVSSDMAAKYVNGMDTMTDILNSNISINCFNLNEDDNEPKKYSSEINFYTNPSGNSTLPSKFKNRKRTSILNNKIFQNIHLDDDLRAEMENEPKMESTPKKQTPKLKNTETQTQNNLDELDKDKKLNEYLAQISKLKRELDLANENVNNLLKKEESLELKLKEKENELLEKLKKPIMLDYSSSTSNLIQTVDKESNEIISELIGERPNSPRNDTNYYQHTLELINIYNNLNIKYRMEAYESLDGVNDMKAMTEFKIKLLFSVVVLSYRYVKIYIRDLKRKIKNILQIEERSISKDRTSSQKSNTLTPTIIVEKVDDNSKVDSKTNGTQVFFSDENRSRKNAQLKYSGRYASITGSSSQSDSENSFSLIDQAINKYLQYVSLTNKFDLSRVIHEVKEQLWGTLQEYPLKDCQELNSYINESVKTAWSIVNHEPILKLDYSSSKFDSNLHERSETSNKNSDQILNFVWPSLIDSSDNKCLSKGIVAT